MTPTASPAGQPRRGRPARARLARAGAVGVVALSTVSACGTGASGGSPITVSSPAAQSDFRGAAVSPALRLPSVVLTDTSGRPWNLAQKAQGRITIVYFGYTHCPDVCPTDMADLTSARRDLPSDFRSMIDIIFVTVDQKRDTPTAIRTWLDRFDPTLIGLTGSAQALATAAHALKVPYHAATSTAGFEKVEHGSQMTAFTRAGESGLVWLNGTPVADIGADMRLLASGKVPV